MILAEGRYSNEGGDLTRELKSRGAIVVILARSDAARFRAGCDGPEGRGCQEIAVLAFASVGAYKGDLSLPGGFPKLIDALVASGHPVTIGVARQSLPDSRFPESCAHI